MPLYPMGRPWDETNNPAPKSGALTPGQDGDVMAVSDPCGYDDGDTEVDAD